jgi:hypothetical protein
LGDFFLKKWRPTHLGNILGEKTRPKTKNAAKDKKMRPSGEISPNLVTLFD